VEGHGQRWLAGVAVQQGRVEQGGRERDGAAAATGGSSRAGSVGVLIACQLELGGCLGVVVIDVTAGTRGTNHAGGGTDVEAVPERTRSAFPVVAAAGSVCGVGRPRRCPRVGKGVGYWPGWAAACWAGRLAT